MMDGRKWRERDVAAAAVASRRCCAAITTTPTQPTQPAASLAAAASVTRLRLRIPSSTACLPHSSPLDSHSAATSTERSSHSPNLWRTCSCSCSLSRAMDVPLALPLPLPPPDLPPPLARNEFSPLEGGIASVLMIDLVLFALAFLAFVAIRYHALTRPPPCLLRTQSTSRFKRFLQLVFRRYNTHNRELEEPTMFGWIWRTIAMSNDEVLARTGRDCFLYL